MPNFRAFGGVHEQAVHFSNVADDQDSPERENTTPRHQSVVLSGRKIRIIGENGSGKSKRPGIMAGVMGIRGPDMERSYSNRWLLSPGADEDLTVRNIEQGLANLRALLDEYDAVNERFAEERR